MSSQPSALEATPPKAEPAEKAEEKVQEAAPQRGVIAEWTVTILLLLFGTTTLVQAFVIPTGSMEDSLLIGDHLLVDKLAYAPSDSVGAAFLPYQEVSRGDIIVFRFPENLEETYVKRVIGVPGDRIRLEERQVYINGVAIEEPYVVYKDSRPEHYRDNFPQSRSGYASARALKMLREHVQGGEVVVPEGRYFAMGDNRDRSSDSRYWGFVPRENIIGKPLIIYWSFDAPTEHLANSTFSLPHLKNLALNFFSKTRWERSFRLIHAYELEVP